MKINKIASIQAETAQNPVKPNENQNQRNDNRIQSIQVKKKISKNSFEKKNEQSKTTYSFCFGRRFLFVFFLFLFVMPT